MLRIPYLVVLVVFIGTNIVTSQPQDCNLVMQLTGEYIESIEWDQDFLSKANQYVKYKEVYVKKLDSKLTQDIFLSSVMLGILKQEKTIKELKEIRSEAPLVKIGISFALCMLEQECDVHKKYLIELGETTQNVAGAVSLRHLEAVEFLSLLKFDGYVEYASRLKSITQEAYQHEAIAVAIERYQKLKKR